ncbi:glycosyl hydrolase family 28-related protein [Pseudorhodoferax sp. Leaf267]|uniref:right-handed parallel beta-helix repeat-containing protein n=1 Tax=Pseudorhodoferax sp. Leaf267 TaxID=1736316 RepID=UPI0006FA86C1|nr:glycosyl hydrolase family 28-related protein [Pseudorhodoferax sp. Leaf267]KQP18810.1 hypothetical protein ASF43_29225 [Pseudorhodoferax sp. Leaf267]
MLRRRAVLAAWLPLAVRAGTVLDVRSFGALGDGVADDTRALQRALDALAPGDVLRFAPGRYVHAQRLEVRTPHVQLLADAATLHASNPDDQALLLQADGIEVRGFAMTAVTDRRRDAPWQSRIAIWRDPRERFEAAPLRDIRIVGNRIVEGGPPGSATANSSSSAAIFVHGVHGFEIRGNEVRRSLSDAIHITGGARDGRIVGNRVRESGDDMVGIVSYLHGRTRVDAQTLAATLDALRARRLVQRILVADNDLAGNYWGRGITVVGGEDVTIERNRIDATSHAAAVYLAREDSYATFGVQRVRVCDNRITRVQTLAPAYSVLPPGRRERRTGHAAVEVVALLRREEAAVPALVQALGIAAVEIAGNTIEDVATDGVRIGDRWQAALAPLGAPVRGVRVRGNRLARVQGRAVRRVNADDPDADVGCEGNRLDGRPFEPAGCGAKLAVSAPQLPR